MYGLVFPKGSRRLVGIELLRCYHDLLYATAQEARRDALILAQSPNPYFTNCIDMQTIGDLCSPHGTSVNDHAELRARLIGAANPDWLVEMHGWPLPTWPPCTTTSACSAGGACRRCTTCRTWTPRARPSRTSSSTSLGGSGRSTAPSTACSRAGAAGVRWVAMEVAGAEVRRRPALRCPVCKKPLLPGDPSYVCRSGHAFDVAREGYVNLLLAHQKHSKEPGYDSAMMASRRRFLGSGAYDRLLKALVEVVPAGGTDLSVLDAGCGEGYYLTGTADARRRSGTEVDGWGIDISKHGVRMAARRDRSCGWVVGNVFDLPVLDARFDGLISSSHHWPGASSSGWSPPAAGWWSWAPAPRTCAA